MEFPHLGKNCRLPSCNRLDFLPFECDSCREVFCSSHFNYERHSCPSGRRRDVQIPLCPLCGDPVPTAPGVEPDRTVGDHIDQQCKSASKKIFTNRCSYKSCKRKELIPVTCTQCKRNFCLRHRHTADHECSDIKAAKPAQGGFFGNMSEADQKKLTANAAEYRRSNKPTTLFNANPKPSLVARASASARHAESIQGNMSEDEALARALALSIMELDESADRNRRIEAAAQNTTVPVGGRDGQQANSKEKCSLS